MCYTLIIFVLYSYYFPRAMSNVTGPGIFHHVSPSYAVGASKNSYYLILEAAIKGFSNGVNVHNLQ